MSVAVGFEDGDVDSYSDTVVYSGCEGVSVRGEAADGDSSSYFFGFAKLEWSRRWRRDVCCAEASVYFDEELIGFVSR